MKHTRVLLWLLLLLTCNFALTSCSNDDDDTTEEVLGDWTTRSQFEGLARNAAVSFTLNGKAYVGLGTDGVDRFKDFWEYTPATNTWRQLADFPGVGRIQAVAFAAGGKGYVGTGYDGVNKLRDFWQYDPTTNSWTRKADFGGTARYGAVALSMEDKGYVGTGYDGNFKKDFWQYDPTADQWTQKPSFGGNKRVGAVAFTLHESGYILAGTDNDLMLTDMWSYSPATEQWTERRALVSNTDEDYDYSNVPRSSASAFVVNNRGFVALGTNGGYLTSCWEYNPDEDTWKVKTVFEGSARIQAVGFGLGDYGYLGLGTTGTTRLDDFWQLAPDTEDAD
ncbi:Kelch repeat-containing protein [Hymenobacter perfusus]|uniref:Galactose oxidase n=1 Tax=Hymenobacter perfusus TaxID=1236770 RepID=A0A3R9NBR3_9BACT|nr:kelch repeat-containing protein [Hymenobacter perfusus]RSK43485.1 galactose oxidase [Hymenobacter perfusus]